MCLHHTLLSRPSHTALTRQPRHSVWHTSLFALHLLKPALITCMTCYRARCLAGQVGAHHTDLHIDTLTSAVLTLFTAVLGKTPRFRAEGGSPPENLALQNIQVGTLDSDRRWAESVCLLLTHTRTVPKELSHACQTLAQTRIWLVAGRGDGLIQSAGLQGITMF